MAEGDAQPAQAQQQKKPGFLSQMMNMMIMYWIVTTGIGYFTGSGKGSSNAVSRGSVGGEVAAAPAVEDTYPTKYWPSVQENNVFKLKMTLEAKYLDPTAVTTTEASIAADENGEEAAQGDDDFEKWVPLPGFKVEPIVMKDLFFNLDEAETQAHAYFNITPCIKNNCTLTAHVEYQSLNDRIVRVNYTTPLVHFFTENVKQLRNLFDDEAPAPLDDSNKTVTKSFYQSTITVCPVVDFTKWQDPGIPPQMKDYIKMIPSTVRFHQLEDGKPPLREGKYEPMVYDNNFWSLKSSMTELNETTPEMVNVTISHYPISMWKFMLYTQMEQAFSMHESTGMVRRSERDETKRIFMETNPYFLAVTMAVSMLHLVFEYLAFSNDVSFWKNKKDFKGLSLRTVAMNCYFQTIIFLYLLDSDTTSWTVWAPSGIGVLIEYWKLRKVIKVTRIEGAENQPIWKRFHVEFESSYDSKTKSYDQQAMKYLTYLLVPGIIGYSGYSAVYHTYKGWYSFFIATQVRFIYFSGFIMMTPQIFINYKLKSVAALPWRTFVYKALNTFIDDMFAFIITMPTMHRLACFRDDIIFFIILYQRWIYPVDKNRTENGATIEDEEEGEDATKKEEDATKAIEESQPAATAEKEKQEKKKDDTDEKKTEKVEKID